MDILNQSLLSCTMRKATGYVAGTLKLSDIPEITGNEPASFGLKFSDNVVVNDRIIDIFGNLSDEEIEKISKVGYDKVCNDVIEIITTCPDISDEELIAIFKSTYEKNHPERLRKIAGSEQAPETNHPQRLRIIRKNQQGTTEPDPNSGTEPDPNSGTEPDPNSGTEPDPASELTLYTLVRKGEFSQTIDVTTEGVSICIQNPMDSKSYYYTVKAKSADVSAYFEVLDNGRFVIDADNIIVEAQPGQADDIILIGNGNTLSTYDGNDIVRLGASMDALGLVANKNETNQAAFNWLTELVNRGRGQIYGNTVNLGDGDDYAFSAFLNGINTIDGGAGADAYNTYYSSYQTVTDPNSLSNFVHIQADESKVRTVDVRDISTFETFGQGGLGDCRLIALLASLKMSGKTLNDLGIGISESGNYINVIFNNFQNAPKYSGEQNTHIYPIPKSSLFPSGSNVYASGDLTVRALEYAMNELIKTNMPKAEGVTLDLVTTSNLDYSRYLFGNAMFSFQFNDPLPGMSVSEYVGTNDLDDVYDSATVSAIKAAGYTTVDDFFASYYGINNAQDYCTYNNVPTLDELWTKYKSGEISNLCCGTDEDGFSEKLQICNSHAYAITNVTSNYVELINPWDSQDRLRLDRADFQRYFRQITSFGNNALDNPVTEDHWNMKKPSGSIPLNTNEETNLFQLDFSNLNNMYYSTFNNTLDKNGVCDEIMSITQQMEKVESVLSAPTRLRKLEMFS